MQSSNKNTLYPQLISRIVTLRQDRQWTYNAKLKRVRTTIVAVEKALSITHNECGFVAFGIQQAKRMRNVMSSVASPAVQ